MILRRVPSKVPLEGVGPENWDFLGPEMATLKIETFWALKWQQAKRVPFGLKKCSFLCTFKSQIYKENVVGSGQMKW